MEDNNNMTLPLEEADNNITESPVSSVEYTDDNIRHLDDMEHIRVRSGMYTVSYTHLTLPTNSRV